MSKFKFKAMIDLVVLTRDNWKKYKVKDIHAVTNLHDYYKITFKNGNNENLEVKCIWFNIQSNQTKCELDL